MNFFQKKKNNTKLKYKHYKVFFIQIMHFQIKYFLFAITTLFIPEILKIFEKISKIEAT